MPYAWDYPAARDKKILLIIGSSRRAVDIMEIGDLMPFKFMVCLFPSVVRPGIKCEADSTEVKSGLLGCQGRRTNTNSTNNKL
jgi:hypothetical protein